MSFSDWLDFTFDHDVDLFAQWHFEDDWSWECPSDVLIERMTRLFEDAGQLPRSYTVAQIDQGFWFIPGPNGYFSAIVDSDVALDARLGCAKARRNLLVDFFGETHLGTSAFMWWDSVFAYTKRGDSDLASEPQVLSELINVMELQCSDPREHVRESGCHGARHALALVQSERGQQIGTELRHRIGGLPVSTTKQQ